MGEWLVATFLHLFVFLEKQKNDSPVALLLLFDSMQLQM